MSLWDVSPPSAHEQMGTKLGAGVTASRVMVGLYLTWLCLCLRLELTGSFPLYLALPPHCTEELQAEKRHADILSAFPFIIDRWNVLL